MGLVTGNSKNTTPKQPKVEILKNIKIHQLEVKLQKRMKNWERERETETHRERERQRQRQRQRHTHTHTHTQSIMDQSGTN